MSLSGLTVSHSRSCLHSHPRGSGPLRNSVSSFSSIGKIRELLCLHRENNCAGSTRRCNIQRTPLIKCAMDASFGDASSGSAAIFPRMNIRDPYKRLGISPEASEDEIQAARNFLVKKYAWHQPSVDAIESAHNKIIMQKFYERKNPKINIKKKVKEVTQHKYVQAVISRFQTPSTKFIMKTSAVFVLLAALTVLFPTEEGPTLQVALSLIATMYFIHDRLKNKLRAFLYGAGAFAASWLVATFLMVSVIPPIPLIRGIRSFEVTTSVITYILLWVSSTYLI